MLFTSVEFIFLFLPVCLIGFSLVSHRCSGRVAVWWLIVASLLFYAREEWKFLALMIVSIVGNYIFGRLIANTSRSWLLSLGVGLNLAVLAIFKYLSFLVGNIDQVLGLSIPMPKITLPLAISFFTFQQISYLVDISRGHSPAKNISHYALFVTFFPHLIAGPLLHHSQMLPQFARQDTFRANYENISVGLMIFTMGLFKKIAFSDPIKAYSDGVFRFAASGQTPGIVASWAGAAAFALQIYFDFSAYSDMAIGLARMFGVKLPRNFESPYKALCIIDFWQRWHITLSRFLRNYLYIPLGGNQRGRARQMANIMSVMLLGGLWHGAGWNFLIWGGIHGVYIVCNHAWRWAVPPGNGGAIARWLSWTVTFIAVVFAWTFFRAPDIGTALNMTASMLGCNGLVLPESYGERLGDVATFLATLGVSFHAPPDVLIYPTRTQLTTIAALLAIAVMLPNTQQILRRFDPVLDQADVKPEGFAFRQPWQLGAFSGAATAALVLALALVSFTSAKNAFIYFQF